MAALAALRKWVGPIDWAGRRVFTNSAAAATITLDSPGNDGQIVILKILTKGTVTALTLTNVGGGTVDLSQMPSTNEITFPDGCMAVDQGQATVITVTGATSVSVIGYIK